jgi:antitoxin ParD1/3/4
MQKTYEYTLMLKNPSVTLGGQFDQPACETIRVGLPKPDAEDAKLQDLRAKLQAGENSPVLAGFDGQQFIAAMHRKYRK